MTLLRCCCGDSGEGVEGSCPSTTLGPTEYYHCELSVTTSGTFFGTGLNPFFTAWAAYCGDLSAGCTAQTFRWRAHGWYGPPCGPAPDVCTALATPSNVVTQATGTSFRNAGSLATAAGSYPVDITAMEPCVLLRCDPGGTLRAFSRVQVTYRWQESADFKLGCYPGPQDSTEHATAWHQWDCEYVRGQTGATWMAAGTYWLRRVVWLSSASTRGMTYPTINPNDLCPAGYGDRCRDSQWFPSPNKYVDTLWTPPDFIGVSRFV